MNVAAWLRELGLECYEGALRDNDVDAKVLPHLTAEDLKDIGITSVGHRRRLLAAIEALRPKTASPELGELSATALPAAEPSREAERRQLTVMFVDLVGSTALSARLDPEDMRAVITAYQNACSDVIRRYDGHVAKFMGDGVLAYFGYPRAHEAEAERAIRAGLEIAAAIGQQQADGQALAARVGIASGQVVVGDLIGEGAAQEEAVVGDTPNVAARLQGQAEPGAVVIAGGTRRLVGGLFEYAELGPTQLKGFAAPVLAWRVLNESRVESRFEALHGLPLTALVGREHEIGLLAHLWEQTREGDGQVVLLSGEPGIGKSRLVMALRERLTGERYTVLSHYGSPYHQNSAFYPVIGLLERAAEFAREDPPAARLGKLERLLAQSTERLDEAVPLVAELLSVSTGERYRPIDLSPQQKKRRTFEILIDQVEGLARRQPVLALYDDVQWMDPSTRELLDLLVERVRHLPVLVVMSFRPEFDPPWTGQAHVTMLCLNRLDRPHIAAMIERMTSGKPLPREALEQIVAKTDGVPLFVEELTKAVLESGVVRDAGPRFVLAGPMPEVAVPATLHDSLMARLDRLPLVKQVAQIGAVIGRGFSHEMLAEVAGVPAQRLQQALDELVASELVQCRGMPPDAVYLFKHALVQDAAYQSLLKSRRQQLHAQIAEVLEARFPETVATQPEMVAHHCTEAGLAARAIELWRRAGEREAGRSAHLEAVAHFQKGLSLIDVLPEGIDRSQRELELLIALGPVLLAAEGMASDRAAQTYGRAHELIREVGEPEQAYAVTWGLWISNHNRGALDEARHCADEVLVIAERTGDPDLILQAHHAAWTTLFFQDDLPGCLEHTERGQALYDIDAHRTHARRFGGHDPGMCACATGGLVLWLVGFPDLAVTRFDEAVTLAEQLDHPVSHAIALFFKSILHQYRREPNRVRTTLDALLAICRENHIPHFDTSRAILQGWVDAIEGNVEDGIAEMRRGLEMQKRSPVGLRRPYYLSVLTDALARSGDDRAALAVVEEGLARRQRADDRNWAPELHRLRGELLHCARTCDDQEVESCFHRALEVARKQGARSLELRAATSLAGFWAEHGERQKAHGLLAPVYGLFTEGFDTADLKEAKALLDELS